MLESPENKSLENECGWSDALERTGIFLAVRAALEKRKIQVGKAS